MIDTPFVYLNGEFLPPGRASVSVFDRGFVFGDGVYEVIPVFGGRLFRLAHHLARLERSLAAIRLENPLTAGEWETVFSRLVRENGDGDQSVYLQVTRGVAPRDHAFPAGVKPTVFAYAQPLKYPPAAAVAEGVAAVTAADIRWLRCDIKAIALLANALLRQQAIDRGAAEAILIRDGLVTEGAASNIFVVNRGTLVTPPNGPFILPGVTRDLVLELAHANGVPAREEPLPESALYTAEEIWMTSSTREILSITRLNDRPVGTGRPGPLHAKLFALYKAYKQAFCEGKVE
ncbi:cytochrome C550 [Sulfurifustis variabilis]|uniref:Aminodeoxychorismate lyase n=1 Tax=Sulfurifustis variabilis TaxID=1675686 RepID=A0A1B4V011_9GAMM|nr:D-amino acid aminotransferase [Sulfurifustis variabilis]BAU46756.1 cytochrome C550 [Sulfurifustis variabilis]